MLLSLQVYTNYNYKLKHIIKQAYEAKVKQRDEEFLEKMAQQRETNSNRKTSFVEINICDKKSQVFKKEKGVNIIVTKKSFWINKSKIFPVLN